MAPMSKQLPDTLEARYAEVCGRIADAAAKAGRKASEVILVAVTKNAEPEQIRGLLQLGHRDFGENRAQVLIQHAAIVDEAIQRMKMLPSARKTLPDSGAVLFEPGSVELKPLAKGVPAQGVRWHMIGHLQRNKAKKIFDLVRLVHSCDSLRLAEELQTIAVKKDTPVEVLLQVNCSGEDQKFGCPLPAAIPLAEQMATMLNIRIRGLMTMAPNVANPEDARPAFSRLRDLFEEMRTMKLTDAPFNILSMGMSNDYEVAISEGANVVRVGSAIFGEPKGVDREELPEDDE
ncbi:MAG TPA: YggS family pyridoxal phosphate-dependent enzyme [Phycisphaerales bacterium]|nr:YggS family pyridoxal phosphate-dependent enzyme [Phycisphaerales bacterium]